MRSSQSPSVSDQYRERDVLPFATKERQAAEEAWSGPPRDLDAPPMAPGGPRMRSRRGDPSIQSPRPTGLPPDAVASSPPRSAARPSFMRRMFRRLARFIIAVSIGVGATLGLQHRGEEVRELAKIYAPSVAWLLPPATTNDQPASAAIAATTTPAAVMLQLDPIARDLAAVRRNVEELAVRQQQMAESIVTMQAVEQEIRQRVLMPPQPVAAPQSQKPAPAAPAVKPPLVLR